MKRHSNVKRKTRRIPSYIDNATGKRIYTFNMTQDGSRPRDGYDIDMITSKPGEEMDLEQDGIDTELV